MKVGICRPDETFFQWVWAAASVFNLLLMLVLSWQVRIYEATKLSQRWFCRFQSLDCLQLLKLCPVFRSSNMWSRLEKTHHRHWVSRQICKNKRANLSGTSCSQGWCCKPYASSMLRWGLMLYMQILKTCGQLLLSELTQVDTFFTHVLLCSCLIALAALAFPGHSNCNMPVCVLLCLINLLVLVAYTRLDGCFHPLFFHFWKVAGLCHLLLFLCFLSPLLLLVNVFGCCMLILPWLLFWDTSLPWLGGRQPDAFHQVHWCGVPTAGCVRPKPS